LNANSAVAEISDLGCGCCEVADRFRIHFDWEGGESLAGDEIDWSFPICLVGAFVERCAERLKWSVHKVHFVVLVFCFRRRRGGFDLQPLSHALDFSSTTFFQENENNFGGLRSRLKPSSAGGQHFRDATKMVRTSRRFS